MELSELLKNLTFVTIALHACCLLILVLLYTNMRNSCIRDGRKPELTLSIVYFACALVILTDCTWTVIDHVGHVSTFTAYAINLVYFLSGSTGTACWYLFCSQHLDSDLAKSKALRICSLIPYSILFVLYFITPWTGLIFSIDGGKYVRGELFFLDPMIKLGYIIATSILAIICGRRRKLDYLKKKDYSMVLYSIPVLICGILQAITGADFNCIGITIGLILIYITGVTNTDIENIDTIYSLSNSFDASYLVNIDTGEIRPLHHDNMHSSEFSEMESNDYTTRFAGILGKILLPDDRESTLKTFELENVLTRFKSEPSFSIRYRVNEITGETSLHTASFIHAAGRGGRQEFLLGINKIQPENLLYERNAELSRENTRLEQINQNIFMSVANIVEARDSGSGEHILRVKKLTEILASEVMDRYPEYGLTEETVELIASASVLHDIGKIVIPDAVLLKPGKLTDEEFEIMKTHSAKGCEVLNKFPLGLDDAFLGYANEICRWHHEKYDGNGYPDGLKGEEIPIAAQIVSVADCYDALVSDRPYKKALPSDVACRMILDGECGEFSPKIRECFINKQKQFCDMAKQYD